ncbi:MAG: hypothetical protein CM15mP68_1360 [Pseudomonadota bacterium]|nr:MAG: hypothetical protein CM15mP68_1360 [Pseudomonadota bacterium]
MPRATASSAKLSRFCKHSVWPKFLNPALLQQPSTRQRQKLLNDWFDALKTLRFVHEAAKYYPDTSLRQTLLSLPPLLRNKITFNTGIE